MRENDSPLLNHYPKSKFSTRMGYQFDSSGFDTWLDIMANMGGALVGYVILWGWKVRK